MVREMRIEGRMLKSIQGSEKLPLVANYTERVMSIGDKDVPFEGCAWWLPIRDDDAAKPLPVEELVLPPVSPVTQQPQQPQFRGHSSNPKRR